jgi:hypothetical protein
MDPVGILTTILVLALIGFIVYLIVTYIPMPEIFKQVLMVVVAVLLILWVMSMLLGSGQLPTMRFQR